MSGNGMLIFESDEYVIHVIRRCLQKKVGSRSIVAASTEH